jgi:hypothetical protein
MGKLSGKSLASRRRRSCPECGSQKVVQIVYGAPSAAVMAKLRAREVVLGGCQPGTRGPQWHCRDCRAEWPQATAP